MPFALIDPRSPWRPLPPLRLASVARSLDIEDIAAVVRRSGIGQERWYGRVERKLEHLENTGRRPNGWDHKGDMSSSQCHMTTGKNYFLAGKEEVSHGKFPGIPHID